MSQKLIRKPYQVVFESVSSIETFATFFTSVTALPAMNQAMLIINRSGKEAFATQRAPNRQKGSSQNMTNKDALKEFYKKGRSPV